MIMDSKVIDGNYITIEELPIGCVVYDKVRKTSIVVGDKLDINLLIGSLERLVNAWYGSDE